jgi:hypothetical protein
MFLNVIDPTGGLTSLDLGAIESWRLELRAFATATATEELPHPPKHMLGLVFAYIVLGQKATLVVAAFDTETLHEAEQVAAVGLPAMTREGNVDRIREAMKVVINQEGQTQASTTALVQQAIKLVNLYHDLLDRLFSQGSTTLGMLDAPMVGTFKDETKVYRYALTTLRNQSWLKELSAPTANPALGLGEGPGFAGPPPPVSKGGKHPPKRGKAPVGGQEPEELGPPSASALLPPLG